MNGKNSLRFLRQIPVYQRIAISLQYLTNFFSVENKKPLEVYSNAEKIELYHL